MLLKSAFRSYPAPVNIFVVHLAMGALPDAGFTQVRASATWVAIWASFRFFMNVSAARAGHAEAHHAAGAVRQVLFSQCIIRARLQAAVVT